MGMMDGVKGQEWRIGVRRGGGKMCSNESEEWHEKGAKWEQGQRRGTEWRD